jgi:restriction endonuclease Mrr
VELVQPIDAIKHAETAIKNAALEATNALRKYIGDMKPLAFELLVSTLFRTLGYKHVDVTKQSADARSSQVGIVVTSSGFSAEAREEAQDPTKAPIALISGQQFAELLLKHQIAIQHIDRKLHRLALDDLAEEKLQARVEEFDEGDS